ncbi:hypothetical protein ACVIWV_002820 [Bradyrhizobium diazoefficiens]|jgi:hypothetical protein|uniref:Uncharacterized protein n=2 Tax=Bradyrhizobium diazoefficiens TaxID=1355477 RepID=A0A837CPG1_9BRAD|nr:hypothetical protein BD122_20443 [Bradyrhizobium diazoefficiens]KGJ70771.1 hypothetical protein BJA5080_06587 [Bradyrhizobium diazoefficiens SEMIA 5080]BAR62547.1 hypothetical protein NK6_9408 [Bradyrhizobium diazoefficiens]
MSDVHELLIRGSERGIGHYRLLLARAKTESERQLYRSRIALAAAAGPAPRRFTGSVRSVSGMFFYWPVWDGVPLSSDGP